jgi:hypothetical protein
MTLPRPAFPAPRSRQARLSRGWAAMVLAGLLTSLAAASAGAAEPPATKPQPAAKPSSRSPGPTPKTGPGKPIEPLLSREELRDCMERQARLRESTAQAAVLQAELEREKAEILREGDALKADLGTLDRSDAAAVESYNSRATARDRRIDTFEPRVAEFNAKAQGLSDDRAAFTRLCENRKFDEKDEKALQKP